MENQTVKDKELHLVAEKNRGDEEIYISFQFFFLYPLTS